MGSVAAPGTRIKPSRRLAPRRAARVRITRSERPRLRGHCRRLPVPGAEYEAEHESVSEPERDWRGRRNPECRGKQCLGKWHQRRDERLDQQHGARRRRECGNGHWRGSADGTAKSGSQPRPGLSWNSACARRRHAGNLERAWAIGVSKFAASAFTSTSIPPTTGSPGRDVVKATGGWPRHDGGTSASEYSPMIKWPLCGSLQPELFRKANQDETSPTIKHGFGPHGLVGRS